MQPPFNFRRLGRRIPAVYAVESPADYLGNVEARHGRPGQSRSTNTYRAYPVIRAGYARIRPLTEAEAPGCLMIDAGGSAVFGSRLEAARAIEQHLRDKGRR